MSQARRFLLYFQSLEVHFKLEFLDRVVEKKLSVLNYVLVTPDRRKQRQLCHINMSKEDVDRNNSTTVHPVSANVAMLETDETVDNFKEMLICLVQLDSRILMYFKTFFILFLFFFSHCISI